MFDLIRDDLRLFEERLATELESRVDFIQAIVDDLVGAGGKRLRPTLAFLTTQMLNARPEVGQQVALTVELLHSASLLHDDIIDDAETRRRKETAVRRYGGVVSVMSGDYMLARVLRLLAQINNPEFTLLVSETAAKVCEGEVLQHETAALANYGLEKYGYIIEGKTAELISASVEGVGVLANAPERERQALRTFGIHYGRAFQMQDDYLDLIGDENDLGKPTGTDLREGKATLPVLLLLERGVDEVRQILARRASAPGDVERVSDLVRIHGVEEEAVRRIDEESRRAVQALEIFPRSPSRDALVRLATIEAARVA